MWEAGGDSGICGRTNKVGGHTAKSEEGTFTPDLMLGRCVINRLRACLHVVTSDSRCSQAGSDELETTDGKGKRRDGSPDFLLLYLLSQVRNLQLPLIIPLAHSHIPSPANPTSQRPLNPVHPSPAPHHSSWWMASTPGPLPCALICLSSPPTPPIHPLHHGPIDPLNTHI